MQQHETIANRSKKWRDNVTTFINRHELSGHDKITRIRNGLHQLIDAAVMQSTNGWTLADETCPVCDADCIFDIKTTVETTRHANNEVEIVSAGNTSTPLKFECCDCNKTLMTSPTAIICPALSSELQPQQTLHSQEDNDITSHNDTIDVLLDVIADQTDGTDWKPGMKPETTEFVVETPVDAYPSKISSGVFHCDTIGERLTTLEYLNESTREPLTQSSAAILLEHFSL